MSQSRQESASADNIDRPQSRSQSLDGTRSGDSSRSHRESVLLSDEQYIVDYLGNSSGSDDEMSIEAKRVTRRKKLEREKLQKLGLFTTCYQMSKFLWIISRDSCGKSKKESLFRWIQK